MLWVILLTMPSGSLFVLAPDPAGDKTALALFPVEKGKETPIKGAFGFPTEEDAKGWIDATASMSEQGKKMMEMCKPHLAAGRLN